MGGVCQSTAGPPLPSSPPTPPTLRHILVLVRQDGQPGQHSPQAVLLAHVVSACGVGAGQPPWLGPRYTGRVVQKWCLCHFASPVPKDSSPQMEQRSASMRLPKNFQPVGVCGAGHGRGSEEPGGRGAGRCTRRPCLSAHRQMMPPRSPLHAEDEWMMPPTQPHQHTS